MKILYAIQATGNGHISRAAEVIPLLSKYGQVDTFVSGANATLQPAFPVTYRSRGISLFYGTCGGLDYKTFLKNTNILRIHREARDLPVEKYDMVINDFEHITSLACRKKKIPSVQFGHQASFQSAHTPRPSKRSLVGEIILKKYATASQYVGLHFQPYDNFILPPVIKHKFLHAQPSNQGHITVYLPSFQKHCLLSCLEAFPDVHFHFFLPGVKSCYRMGNVSFKPVSSDLFDQSLLTCEGIITGAGFETPSEALYLGKKLMCIPIRGQYEQQCNAAALSRLGVTVLEDIGPDFVNEIGRWLQAIHPGIRQKANHLEETVAYLMDTYPFRKPAFDFYSYEQVS